MRYPELADQKRALLDIKTIQNGVMSFRMEYRRWPKSLEELVTPPDSDMNRMLQILPEIPIDPWNNPYQYTIEDNQIIIVSFGKDGQEGTGDDLTNLRNPQEE